MSLPALDNLAKLTKGGLKSEPANSAEIAGLLRSAKRKRQDAALPDLGDESRFDLLYNAAHALALAALRHHGYRSENRILVFQALAHTVSWPAEKWRVLDRAHQKRNLAEYEGQVDVDPRLLAELATVLAELEVAVVQLASPTG